MLNMPITLAGDKFVSQGIQTRLLGFKLSGVLGCANSVLEDSESDLSLSVEFFSERF